MRVQLKGACLTESKQANVCLGLSGHEFVGCCETDAAPLRAIALATVDALNQALHYTIGKTIAVVLQAVDRIQTEYLTDPIFVVVMNATVGERSLKLVGVVVAKEKLSYRLDVQVFLVGLSGFE